MKNFRRSLSYVFVLIFSLPAIACRAVAADLNELEAQFAGSEVSEITFDNWTNLDQDDFLRSLSLQTSVHQTGAHQARTTLAKDDLLTLTEALYQRGIFENVDISIQPVENGIVVHFTLSPYLIYSLIEFSGVTEFSESLLARVTGVRTGQRLNLAQLEEAVHEIQRAYTEEGYYHTTVSVELLQRKISNYINVVFHINEGNQSEITQADLRGTIPDDIKNLQQDFHALAIGAPASKRTIDDLKQYLLQRCRSEGYLETYVRVENIEHNPLSGDIQVIFDIEPHDPITIIFSGNESYTPEELLTPLDLANRTIPFSPNAIPNLARKIKTFYQERGYVYAEVTSAQREKGEDKKREIYEINIREGKQQRIDHIAFEGNLSLPQEILQNTIKTQAAGWWWGRIWRPGFLVEEQLQIDTEALREIYRGHGFFQTEVEARFDFLDQESFNLVFAITEGARSFFQSVNIVWKNLAQGQQDEFSELLGIQSRLIPGTPFTQAAIDADQDHLSDETSQLGFPLVKLTAEADPVTGAVLFQIDPGPRIRIGKIFLSGNKITHDSVIVREFRFQEGDWWDILRLQETERALYSLGHFRSVHVRARDNKLDSPIEDIVVEVDERDTLSVELGTGIDTEDGLHLIGGIRQRNWAGDGYSVGITMDGYFKTGHRLLDAGRARASFENPRFFETKTEFLTELFTQTSIKLNDEFSYDRTGTLASFRHPLFDNLDGRIGITFFNEDVFDVPPDLVIGPDDEGSQNIALLGTTVEWDTRNDRFNPRSGFRFWLDPEVATDILGSDLDYVSITAGQSIYVPIRDTLVWASNVRYTQMVPFSDTTVIPLSQRLFLGGRSSLRGFSPNSIGPRSEEGNIVGGDVALVLNTELQLDVSEAVMGVLFVDAGQAALRYPGEYPGNPLSLDSLRYSPGFGVRYKSPIGPVGLDVGFALNREFGERWGRLHLSIGGAF